MRIACIMQKFMNALIWILTIIIVILTGCLAWAWLGPGNVQTKLLTKSDDMTIGSVTYEVKDVFYSPVNSDYIFINIEASNHDNKDVQINLSDWTYGANGKQHLPHWIHTDVDFKSLLTGPDMIPETFINDITNDSILTIRPEQSDQFIFVFPAEQTNEYELNYYDYSKDTKTPLYRYIINLY